MGASEEESKPQFVCFVASLPVSGTPVRMMGDGSLRVTLEVPANMKADAVALMALTGCVLRVTVEVATEGMLVGGDAGNGEKLVAVELLSGVRQSAESSRAVQACNDYLRMGAGRSLGLLRLRYLQSDGTDGGPSDSIRNRPPTRSEATLKEWSAGFEWVARAEEYDRQVDELKTVRVREAMETGLAIDYERVLKLKRLAGFLEDQVYERDVDGVFYNVWMPDVKQIGSGEYAERVDIERFNAPIIEQLRETLNDLAAETGGRRKKVELTGKDGGPVDLKITEVVIEMPGVGGEGEG